jgi:hypothetical protein
MYELVTNQVFGIDGLVNLSNIVLLVAFSARDVLKLRLFVIFRRGSDTAVLLLSARNTMGATFLQRGIHGGKRGPHRGNGFGAATVLLSEKEEQLYRIAFTSIEKREFLKFRPVGRLFTRGGGHPRKARADLRCDCPHLRRNRSHACQ